MYQKGQLYYADWRDVDGARRRKSFGTSTEAKFYEQTERGRVRLLKPRIPNKEKIPVESLREIVQDLLVPELKSLKVSIDSLHHELHSEVAAIRGEMTSLRSEMAIGFEAVRTEMRLRDEKQSQAIQALSDKLGYAIDIRERLAVLEDRSARS